MPVSRKRAPLHQLTKTLPAIRRRAQLDTPVTFKLWGRHASGDAAATDALCEHYAPLVFLHAWILKARMPDFYVDDLDDLVGDGLLALVQLIQKTEFYYNPAAFRALLKIHIRGAIRRGVENRWWRSRHADSRKNIVRQTRATFTAEQGRVPTREELTDALAGVIANPQFYTAHKPRQQAIGASARVVAADTPQPDELAVSGDLMRFAMKGLKGQERKMFRLLMAGHSAEEIGRLIGVSGKSARKRLNGLIWTLRQRRDLAATLGVDPMECSAGTVRVPGPAGTCTYRSHRSAQLTAPQRLAAELFARGLDGPSVAQQVGIHYQTVMKWKNHHPLFVTELARQRELLGTSDVPAPGRDLHGRFAARRVG